MKPIVLSVKRSVFRCDDPSAEMQDKVFKKLIPTIKSRDNDTCQYCGLVSHKYLEIHHVDDDHSNNNPENLVTICPLCHACFHLGFSGVKQKGLVIYIDPSLGLTQGELNSIVRTLWIGERSQDNAIKTVSISILSRFVRQQVAATRKLGTSECLTVANSLLVLSDEDYENRAERLSGIYFFPYKDAFSKFIDYLSETTYSGFKSDYWYEENVKNLKKWSETLSGKQENNDILSMINEDY